MSQPSIQDQLDRIEGQQKKGNKTPRFSGWTTSATALKPFKNTPGAKWRS